MSHRPLAGTTVAVTRATSQASALSSRLTELGADVVELPTIEVVDAADGGAALTDALTRLDGVHWLVVTSANGAERVADAHPDLPAALERHGTRLAVIGPGTAAAAVRRGLRPQLEPERFVAEGLLEAFPPPPPDGGRVVLAQAAGARPVLVEGLRRAGWQVTAVEAYRTVHPQVPADAARRARQADVVTFTSASTVTGYVAAVGIEPPPRAVACIGPITAEAARAAGLRIDVVADPHTIEALARAVVALVTGEGG